MRRTFIIVIPLLVMAAACGGGSPVDPSNGGGAKISGQFVSPGQGSTRAMQSVAASPSAQGLTVSVNGTGITVPVSGNQFSLSGVPAGPLSLRFSGNGMDSELGLAPVEGTESIDITLSLNGSGVTLESERRSFGKEVQLEGLVDSVGPAPGAFVVAGQPVTTTVDTRFFFHGDPAAFTDVAVGYRVHVKGQSITGSLSAMTVMIQSTNTDDVLEDDSEQDESASIEGVLASIGGSGDVLTLLVGSTTVFTNGLTRVKRRGDTQELDVLEIGMRLHVVGTRQTDSSILARMIQIKGDAAGSAFEVEGSMGGVKGTCPSLTFSINGFAIATNGATVFTPACSTAAYKSGTKATVEGIVQSNGSVIATSVTK